MKVDKVADNTTLLNDTWGDIKLIKEFASEIPEGDPTGAVLSTIEGPIMSYTKPTRNDRLYTKNLCQSIINSPYVQEMIKTKSFLGEADHPADDRLNVHFPLVSHSVRDIRDDPMRGCYMATIDILDTPQGRILDTLRRYGTKLGISSRGAGRVIQRNGESVVDEDSYIFSTFDIVHYPGNIDARLKPATSASTNESLSYDKDKLESPASILYSYILSESENPEVYGDASNFDEIVNTAMINNDLDTLSYARMILNSLGISHEMVKTIEEYLSKYNKKSIDNSSKNIIESLNTELKSKSSEVDKLLDTISDLSTESKMVNKLKEEVIQLTQELQDANSEKDKVTQELKLKMKEIKELSYRVMQLTQSKLKLIKSYEDKLDKMNEKVKMAEDRYDNLYSDYEDLSKKYDELKDSNKSMVESYTKIRCDQLGLNYNFVKTQSANLDSFNEVENLVESYSKMRDSHKLSKPKVINSVSNVKLNESVIKSSSLTKLVKSVKDNKH